LGKELRIEVVKTARTESIVDLYQDAGWWEEGWNQEVIPAMVANSFRFVGLFDGDELVGMGRALSDGVSDAYIQDIVVRTDYRGLGWGMRIVNRLVCELRDAGIDWIGLIGQPGTKSFYEKLGFNEMPQFIPMKYQC
jgi:ribosomal protein S18 acetylase RimI-like enzyme